MLRERQRFLLDDCSFFFKQEMELSLIGLENVGKTSLVNVIAVTLLDGVLNLIHVLDIISDYD